MKKTFNVGTCIVLAFMLVGCFDSESSNDDAVISICVSEDSVSHNLDEMLEIKEIIPVKSDNKIASVGKVLISSSGIYVLDDIQKSVFIIANNGDVHRMINAKGRGRGEYLTIDDIETGEDDTLYLLDSDSQQILQYQNDGKFMRTVKSCIGDMMALNDDKFFVNCGQNEEYNVSIIDSNGNIENKIPLPHNYPPMNIGHGCVTVGDNGVYITNPFDHTIYIVKNNTCVPAINIDFGSKAIDDDILKEKDLMVLHQKVLASDKIIFIKSFIFAGNYLLVITDSNDKYLCDLETQRCVCLNLMPQPYAILFSNYLSMDKDGNFIAMIPECNMRILIDDTNMVSNYPCIASINKTVSMDNDDYWIIKGCLL